MNLQISLLPSLEKSHQPAVYSIILLDCLPFTELKEGDFFKILLLDVKTFLCFKDSDILTNVFLFSNELADLAVTSAVRRRIAGGMVHKGETRTWPMINPD